MKILNGFQMDYFNKLPQDIGLEILSRVPAESMLECKLVCRNWREILTDNFTKLPNDIKFEILSCIPADSIFNCKSVCKSWRNIVDTAIKDPYFSQKHLHHLNHPSAADDSCKLGFVSLTGDDYYLFEYDNVNHELTKHGKRKISKPNFWGCLVGSCNGLLCTAREEADRLVCIFNPVTKECVVLPEIRSSLVDDSETDNNYYSWSFGFGYLSLTDQYKVIGIFMSNSKFLKVYIYTIGSGNGWTELGENFNIEFSPLRHYEFGRFVNEAVYWIGSEVEKIIIFDLIEEKFCVHLDPPTLRPLVKLVDQTIGVLDGVLYIAVYETMTSKMQILTFGN